MKRFWQAGFAVVLAVCVAASCLAYGGMIRLEVLGVPNLDFYGHLVFMGLLAFFADGLLGHRLVARALRLGPALVLAAAASDEVLQRFSTHRSSTWSDFVADAIGVTLGALAATHVARALTARECRAPAG
jgi:hypothetical protein